MLGREMQRQRRWSSLQKSDRIVPAGATEGFWFGSELIQLLNPSQEIQVGKRQEAAPAPSPGKRGSLLPRGAGWGKDPLLPVPSGPTVLPATQDRDPEPRAPPRHQHNHEQATASTRKGYKVFGLFAKTWGPCKCHYEITLFSTRSSGSGTRELATYPCVLHFCVWQVKKL